MKQSFIQVEKVSYIATPIGITDNAVPIGTTLNQLNEIIVILLSYELYQTLCRKC